MKTLYFECNMGAAGDMLMAALLELHNEPAVFLNRLNNAGIPNALITAQTSVKCGINGTRVKVEISGREESGGVACHGSHEHIGHEHSHNGYHQIGHLIEELRISDTVKKNALEVYRLIADAESHVHGVPVNRIHFHEVGEIDAVADIVGVCMLVEELAPDMIIASPINVGSGQVRCAHGILPVPAPATARILREVPIYSGHIKGELCTPTGAALLKHFVKEFRDMPVITVTGTGYGMGSKDFENANCVRAYIGNSAGGCAEEITELVCNLDDMTPEAVAFAQQLLLDEGALDAYTAPIGMKKGRAGLSLTCMCKNEEKDRMAALIFTHTTTLGIRERTSRRYTLKREEKIVKTRFGEIRVKTAHGFGIKKSKPEYEDIAEIARRENKSMRDILEEIER